ncbi:hypothetical protein Poly21_20000 [Allorhodopirellula heiligendammensis]|uniref:Uncharacterized protein n=1 Tax=Allorhodopirellula heiligendammensis TaxID=2714739 RepID=A0A5C6C6V5_9BACT|nr:hypothetical protein Poly21_20000 [Allorhodopirellula heiligendammensis]
MPRRQASNSFVNAPVGSDLVGVFDHTQLRLNRVADLTKSNSLPEGLDVSLNHRRRKRDRSTRPAGESTIAVRASGFLSDSEE